MRWVLFVFSYSIMYFIVSFIVLCLGFGGYSLVYSKMKYDVFELHIDYSDVFFLSLKVAFFIFLSISLHVIFIQIPNQKRSSYQYNGNKNNRKKK
ncbi:hypothetical protein Q7469_11490 [Glaesserella parasuis]|uniref:hypothetical protein n=1 Tax=Glaesserella parasuis TaxID=738 RepID=UPI00095013B6|nr:hypothetical protein [Glaesserella parasuis]MDG6346884.1 hypothetical protein [Glaesserella parasuis]MDG6772509.1 hypothetical protein [Glaesserella parasuis]MDO9874565.1 hypothetical protein [Glaesserella parasuis]MDO9914333.1 hypothetical protein [Glaesserella parasuis]MDP0312239.1 hypothetical protein [Glaesserella parasuis]